VPFVLRFWLSKQLQFLLHGGHFRVLREISSDELVNDRG
jgi:hypothetical protein